MIRMKRAFDKASPEDGYRVLVDRKWPLGVRKEALALGYWAKELAPSEALREFYHHDPRLWEEFRERFRDELQNDAAIKTLTDLGARSKTGVVTLVYASREPRRNNAFVVKQIIDTYF